MKRALVILALLLATPAVAQTTLIYQLQADGTILVTPLDGRPSWIIVPAPGTAPAYPSYGVVQQPLNRTRPIHPRAISSSISAAALPAASMDARASDQTR